ncbi:hypothetical protein NDU88_000104 [Pleurodeles waltl]|uniref:Zonadhesin n=1 Tax=Pleurodeles waltl TaxID=8319 RepID=A0AAV7L8R2_PLEWA|nr:hypothetical protein NDU88_000104 [Pleurodeles waltl]
MLAKVCGQGSSVPFFNVSATNEFRGSNTKVSYVKSVHVDVYSSRITLLKNKKVNVNGKRMGLPIEVAGGRVTIRNSGIYVLLQTDFRLAVRFDGNHYADVSVPQACSGQLCGLCGNYNGDPGDDNIKPDGTIAKDSNDLGDSWILLEKNEICSTGGVGEACDPTLETEVQKDTACGIISDPSGIFKDCHAKVPPQNFFKSCVFDMCATGGQSLSLCYALQAYAAHCTNAGVCVQWRNNTLCPISCPGGSRYESCGSRCPTTCFATATSGSCSSAPTEGCFCEEGFVLSGDRCVPRTECGCTDVDNNYHQLGESWYTHSDCSERCTCNHNNTIACTSWKCGPQERCDLADGVLSCHSTGKASCHVAGDPHYFTFDKVMHTFLGTCTYTLVQVCDNSSVIPLTISGKNEDRGIPGATYLREVYIDVYDTRVTLQKSRRTLLNNERVHSPVVSRARGISIGTVGIYTVVETDFGMLVKFDGNQHLEISLPDSYHSKVCGMCGNYNGNSNDELLMPDGRLADNVAQFGNSWKAKEDNTAGCLPDDRKDFDPPCKAGQQPGVEQQCNVLLSAAFVPCHALVDPNLFIQTCVYDMCKYDGMLATFCAIAQAYVDACRIEGISIKWRNTTLCPLPCPTNSHYTDCASLCPPTCNDIYASATCEKLSDCVEGCVCDEGYVLSDDKCVPLGDCGCRTINDTYYQVGESWITPHCTEKCQCRKGGKIKCNPYECEPGEVCILKNNGNYGCKPTGFAKCSVTGDPHYLTFDGLVHHFQGVGTYTLVQNPADLPDRLQSFNIEGKNEKMVQNYKISYIEEIRTDVYGHSVLFRQKKKILLDGIKVVPPAQPHEGLKIYQRSTRIYLETDFGLSVSFDGTENADITLPNTYKKKVEGLCGNFDGKHKNDFTRRDGQQVKDVNDFGESWKVPSGKATLRFRREVVENDTDIGDLDTGFFTNCSESELLLANSTAYCGLLVDQSGPFNACHEAIDPDLYHTNCLFDMCAAFDRRDLFCESLQQYALACQEVKVTLGNWRQDGHCEMACPPHSEYSSCMTACPATCSDMAAASECDSPCLEGCRCLPGYVFSDEDCVPYKECGCTYLNKYYKTGESFVTDDCSQTCTCTESSSVACSRIACRQGQTCTISNFTRGCFMLDPCLDNPCQNGGECVQEHVETDNTTTVYCRCRNQYEGFYCEKEKGVSIVIIVVGVIAAVVVLVFLVIGIVLCVRSRLRRKMMFQQELIDNGQDNSSIGTRSHSRFRSVGITEASAKLLDAQSEELSFLHDHQSGFRSVGIIEASAKLRDAKSEELSFPHDQQSGFRSVGITEASAKLLDAQSEELSFLHDQQSGLRSVGITEASAKLLDAQSEELSFLHDQQSGFRHVGITDEAAKLLDARSEELSFPHDQQSGFRHVGITEASAKLLDPQSEELSFLHDQQSGFRSVGITEASAKLLDARSEVSFLHDHQSGFRSVGITEASAKLLDAQSEELSFLHDHQSGFRSVGIIEASAKLLDAKSEELSFPHDQQSGFRSVGITEASAKLLDAQSEELSFLHDQQSGLRSVGITEASAKLLDAQSEELSFLHDQQSGFRHVGITDESAKLLDARSEELSFPHDQQSGFRHVGITEASAKLLDPQCEELSFLQCQQSGFRSVGITEASAKLLDQDSFRSVRITEASVKLLDAQSEELSFPHDQQSGFRSVGITEASAKLLDARSEELPFLHDQQSGFRSVGITEASAKLLGARSEELPFPHDHQSGFRSVGITEASAELLDARSEELSFMTSYQDSDLSVSQKHHSS